MRELDPCLRQRARRAVRRSQDRTWGRIAVAMREWCVDAAHGGGQVEPVAEDRRRRAARPAAGTLARTGIVG
ncbi:hypothetical protein ACFXHK_47465, partial [Embleya sp. NPDC059267]|uniref:hypothetical protein n=1 Tax=Embleya sp. NPDC059267 TaxID=3346798 RepID=UPI0036931673